jgi:Flp pilus assembly pilin Flp
MSGINTAHGNRVSRFLLKVNMLIKFTVAFLSRFNTMAPQYNDQEVLMKTLYRLLCDESATVAMEYALIGTLISIAAIAGMTAVGGGINLKFTTVRTEVQTAFSR